MLANLLRRSSTQASAEAMRQRAAHCALPRGGRAATGTCARLAEAMRARGAYVVVSSLPRCAFDTQLESGIDIPGFDGALPDARVRALDLAGTLEQITFRLGHPACPARKRRAGVERCARHRALRRQIGDDVPAAQGRHPDAAHAHLETQAAGRVLREGAEQAADLQAAVRLAGQRPLRIDATRPSFPLPKPSTTSITCRISCRRPALASRTGASRHAQSRRRRHDAPRPTTGSPTSTRAASPSAHDPSAEMARWLRGRDARRRRRLCRRRSDPHARRAAAGARGQLATRRGAGCKASPTSTSPRRSPRTSSSPSSRISGVSQVASTMPRPDASANRRSFLAACRAELDALKPGNVHVHAGGHGMEVAHFEASAAAAAPFRSAIAAMKVGTRILRAVEASFAAAGCNTNLGILLLCAPLAAAAETAGRCRSTRQACARY